jgi:hypothetical protein
MTNETKAGCPEGFTQTTKEILINGCLYKVEICYKCAGVSTDQTIKLNGFGKLDSNCIQSWTTQQVAQAIYSTITDPNYFRQNLCAGAPPCSNPQANGLHVWCEEPVCWQKERATKTFYWYHPCITSSCYCVTQYLVCWDPVSGVAMHTPIGSSYLEGDNCDCPIIEPPDPIYYNFPTTCFKIITDCIE